MPADGIGKQHGPTRVSCLFLPYNLLHAVDVHCVPDHCWVRPEVCGPNCASIAMQVHNCCIIVDGVDQVELSSDRPSLILLVVR